MCLESLYKINPRSVLKNQFNKVREFVLKNEFTNLLGILFFYLILWQLFRFTFSLVWFNKISVEPRLYKMILKSLRFDVLTFCYILGAPFLVYFLCPSFIKKKLYLVFAFAFACFCCFAVYMEMLSFTFFDEFGNRPDQVAIEYLKYPNEVISMIFKGYLFAFTAAVSFALAVAFFHFKMIAEMIQKTPAMSYLKKVAILPFILAFLFVGARSSFGHRPANISSASFSNYPIVNELTLNSTYSAFYALYRMKHEANPYRFYSPKMEINASINGLGGFSLRDGKSFTFKDNKLEFSSEGTKEHGGKLPSINIIIVESLGSQYTGIQGGTKLTPEFDRIAKTGVFFDNFYATGTRTARGLEAILTGFPPTPGRSVVKLNKTKQGFYTLASHLKKYGYSTNFFCGGDTNFDEMKAFLLRNGFDSIYDVQTLSKQYKAGSWGVHDKDVYDFFLKNLKDDGKPQLNVFLTTSNHSPFDYPLDEGFELDKNYAKDTHENAVKYTDYAIGYFYDQMEKRNRLEKDLFFIVADHNTRVYGDKYIPVYKFHIPALLFGRKIEPRVFSKIASSIDVPQTLLGLVLPEVKSPSPGFNLFKLPEDYNGRAVMQYNKNLGYFEDNKIAVLRPGQSPVVFSVQDHKLTENITELGSQMVEKALSYTFGAWNLYDQQIYR
jgi:phosphoglycerol transferase MdoB-like AlkP superfamily enzyme